MKAMKKYKAPDSSGFLSIPVLGFLTGMPWDDHAKNFLMALRPSCVRETWGEIKCDAVCWRVTVLLAGTKTAPLVQKITQEVMVGLSKGDHQNGHELSKFMSERGMERFFG